jgi:hypothetical protein
VRSFQWRRRTRTGNWQSLGLCAESARASSQLTCHRQARTISPWSMSKRNRWSKEAGWNFGHSVRSTDSAAKQNIRYWNSSGRDSVGRSCSDSYWRKRNKAGDSPDCC